MRPRISIVIPTLPGAAPPLALESLTGELGLGTVEVIVSQGRSVSRQRNQAVMQAKAPVVVFLDDDTEVPAQTLLLGLSVIESEQAEVVGGPALTRGGVGLFEGAAGLAISSRFGMFHAAARARPRGEPRATDGEEYSLCNLMMRRDLYLAVDGLDESLYPGEDPDLWRRLGRAKAKMMYHPEMVVYRGRRRGLLAFALQHFKYGQGRGVRLERWRPQEVLYLVPTFFTLYLMLIPWLPKWGLQLYCALSCLASLRAQARSGSWQKAVLCGLLFPVMHISYGLGMALGLLGWGPTPGRGEPELESWTLEL